MPVSEIDFRVLIRRLWRGKAIILLSLAVSILFAIIYLNVANYRYTITLIVTPVQAAGSSISGKNGGLVGLAGLAGVSLPTDASSDAFKLYLEGLKSRPVADVLATDDGLMSNLFPAEWSPADKKWHEPESIWHTVANAIRRIFGIQVYPWRRPDGGRLQDILQRDLEIVETRDQPAVNVTFATTDPEFGVEFLNRLHHTVDRLIKKRVLERATDSIAYLQRKLSQEKVEDYRLALIQQEAQQEQLRMMASSNVSYAADPFGPPTASPLPVSPRALYVFIVAILLGLTVGAPLALSGIASE